MASGDFSSSQSRYYRMGVLLLVRVDTRKTERAQTCEARRLCCEREKSGGCDHKKSSGFWKVKSGGIAEERRKESGESRGLAN